MDDIYRKLLKKQQYYPFGNNSAVKICSWTKKSIQDQGVCYKEKFYGIRSHRCCQMTPDVQYCQNACIFCWRNLEGSEKNQKNMHVDDPVFVIEESIKGHNHLLNGYPGNSKTNMKKYHESEEPMHFAISLSGEPTMYPKLAELVLELHKKKKSTFIVTNGLLPDQLRLLEKKKALPTQLYVSLDAPNKELFFKIDRCSFKDGWERLLESFDVLKSLKKQTRTAVRITLIKNMNMIHPGQYAVLLERSDATYVEIKAYMHVGSSRERLLIEQMPYHEEVKAFAEEICKHCSYKFIDEQVSSRVVLLMKEDGKERIMKF
ncbi:MAG: 4-demethylwyosine synthase TYW1 [Candidatus Woesearchaeota archaeon]